MSELPPELLCQIAENLLPNYDWPNRPSPLEQKIIAPLLTVSSAWNNALRPLLYRAVDLSSEKQARGFLHAVRQDPETVCTRRIRFGFARPPEEPESGFTEGDDTYAEQWQSNKAKKYELEVALVIGILGNLGGSVRDVHWAMQWVPTALVLAHLADVERFTFQHQSMRVDYGTLPEASAYPRHITRMSIVTSNSTVGSPSVERFLREMAEASKSTLTVADFQLATVYGVWAAPLLLGAAANLREITIADPTVQAYSMRYESSAREPLFNAATRLETVRFFKTPFFLDEVPIGRLKRLIIDRRLIAGKELSSLRVRPRFTTGGKSWEDFKLIAAYLNRRPRSTERKKTPPGEIHFLCEKEFMAEGKEGVCMHATLLMRTIGCTLTVNGELMDWKEYW